MTEYKFIVDMPLDPTLNNPTSVEVNDTAMLAPDFTEVDYAYCYTMRDESGSITGYCRLTHPYEELPMTEEEKADMIAELSKAIESGEIDADKYICDSKDIDTFYRKRDEYFAERGTTYAEFCKQRRVNLKA